MFIMYTIKMPLYVSISLYVYSECIRHEHNIFYVWDNSILYTSKILKETYDLV